jgi:hypothetical protein
MSESPIKKVAVGVAAALIAIVNLKGAERVPNPSWWDNLKTRLKTRRENLKTWWDNTGQWWMGISIAVFVPLALYLAAVYLLPKATDGPPKSQLTAAAALALIGAAAVAIERIIEFIWTAVGLSTASWAPLRKVGTAINDLMDKSNKALESYQKEAKALLDNIGATIAEAERQVSAFSSMLTNLQRRPDTTATQLTDAQKQLSDAWDELHKLQAVQAKKVELTTALAQVPPVTKETVHDKQEVLLYATRLTGAIDSIQAIIPKFQAQATLAKQSVATLTSFVDSFKDNPARRLVSIYIGALFGLSVTYAFQLDVFQAILQPDKGVTEVGVALTGLVIGLGTNPTHQVIRLLEEFKKSQKGNNTDTKNTDTENVV